MPLLLDGKIETGFLRERVLIKALLRPAIPEPALKWAKREAEKLGIPVEEVLKSQPFKEYVRSLWGG